MRNNNHSRLGLTLRIVLCATVLVAGVGLITSQVASQEKGDEKAKKQAPSSEKDEMMAAWMKYAMPGEHHAYLKPMTGRWDQVVKMRWVPDVPMTEHKGTCENKWILGGRFLMQEIEGELMGDQPFEGLGFVGYDNYKKKYVAMWIDTMSTMMFTMEGRYSQSEKVFTFTGEYDDAMTGKKKKSRSVTRFIDNDKYVEEMFMDGPDGKEFKMMEITYWRKK